MSNANSTPKRAKGRPLSIDRVAALDAAVRTFWMHGYEGTSLTDLTGAMKLSRPSLYAGFGDKADLFVAALGRYEATIGCKSMEAFERTADIEEAVRAFLVASLESVTQPGLPAGCLLASCASTVAQSNPGIRELLGDSIRNGEQRLAGRFEAETASGALSSLPSPLARAALLIDLRSAQAIRARSGESRQALMAGLEARVAAVTATQPI